MVNNFRALRSETELLLAGRVALVSWARVLGGAAGRRGRGVLALSPGLRKPRPLWAGPWATWRPHHLQCLGVLGTRTPLSLWTAR